MAATPLWRGVYSVISAKFNEPQNVDCKAIKRDIAWQVGSGVHGITCCGPLGEASTPSAHEKIAIAEAAMDASDGRRRGL